uniref:Uncharacterized protein n=1 Tax=Anguilla anguilla TaxID=7936 RepID=A0A0E9Q572_ANGAN
MSTLICLLCARYTFAIAQHKPTVALLTFSAENKKVPAEEILG